MTLPYKSFNRVLVILNLLLFAGYWIYMFLVFQNLPEQIPIHFNLSGDAVRFAESTAGNWFLVPLIITFSGLHEFLIAWALLSAGFESWNFPEKKKVLQLSAEEQKPFKKIVTLFVYHILLLTAAYILLIGIFLAGFSSLYAFNEAPSIISSGPVILVLTIAFLGWLGWQYIRVQNLFKERLLN